MRVPLSVADDVGVTTFRRTKRPLVVTIRCVVIFAVFPVTVATVLKLLPSLLSWRLKSRVFQIGYSPLLAPACLTMI